MSDNEPLADADADCWRLSDPSHRGSWRKVETPYSSRWRYACPICHPDDFARED